MIRNDRQLKITERKLREARASADSLSDVDREVMLDFAAELKAQVHEYLQIRAGDLRRFPVVSIDDLAKCLVQARVFRSWSQARLAKELGVSEQMVQRDEAGGYERATLARLADIADVLAFELKGELVPKGEPGVWAASGKEEGRGVLVFTQPASARLSFSNEGSVVSSQATTVLDRSKESVGA